MTKSDKADLVTKHIMKAISNHFWPQRIEPSIIGPVTLGKRQNRIDVEFDNGMKFSVTVRQRKS